MGLYCILDKLIDACDCCELNIECLRNKSFCRLENELRCVEETSVKTSKSDINKICKECTPQCDSVHYDLVNYVSDYPSNYYYDNILGPISKLSKSGPYEILSSGENILKKLNKSDFEIFSRIKLSLVKLTLNYNEIKFTITKQNPLITGETLIGIFYLLS